MAIRATFSAAGLSVAGLAVLLAILGVSTAIPAVVPLYTPGHAPAFFVPYYNYTSPAANCTNGSFALHLSTPHRTATLWENSSAPNCPSRGTNALGQSLDELIFGERFVTPSGSGTSVYSISLNFTIRVHATWGLVVPTCNRTAAASNYYSCSGLAYWEADGAPSLNYSNPSFVNRTIPILSSTRSSPVLAKEVRFFEFDCPVNKTCGTLANYSKPYRVAANHVNLTLTMNWTLQARLAPGRGYYYNLDLGTEVSSLIIEYDPGSGTVTGGSAYSNLQVTERINGLTVW